MTTHAPPLDLYADPVVVPCCGVAEPDLPGRDSYCLHPGRPHVDCPGRPTDTVHSPVDGNPTEGSTTP